MPQSEAPNPVHMATQPHTRWTTVNFAEAIQGVQTPLGWTVWSNGMEPALRRTFAGLGALPAGKIPVPEASDDRLSGIFYGRAAGNIDVFRYLGDRMPGSSGDTVEEKLFGVAPPSNGSRKPLAAYLRYPAVALKMPRSARRPPRAVPGMRAEYGSWWQRATLDAPPRTLADAQALMAESTRRFTEVGVQHATASMLGVSLLDALGDLAERATGDRSVAMELATGYGGMEETGLLHDIWLASKGELDRAELIRRHGYHGPDEGDLRTRTWREDASPLDAFMRSYQRPGVVGPREREQQQVERRKAAETRLLGGLPAPRRAAAKLTIALAARYIPIREIGKASFLHTIDGARCAARAGGAILAEQRLLDDPEDVFFLTYEEFLGRLDAGAKERVAQRKERDAYYRTLALPPSWAGVPEVTVITDAAAASANGNGAAPVAELRGIGVVGDTVVGRARVVVDPSDADLDDGDILVCATTDPSWTPLFLVADALVIDTGGQMSHGAIVARELGVTCVINTVTGTRDIPDGATITVDGRSGVVTIGA